MTNVLKKIGLTLLYLVELLGLMLLGSLIGAIIVSGLRKVIPSSDTWITAQMYLSFLGIWLVVIGIFGVVKKVRPIFETFGTKFPGNNIKNTFIGLGIGFGLNGICILVAAIKGDIKLSFDNFNIISIIILFVVVFIQSSAEELLCRGVLYQRLIKLFKNPLVAIIGNSLLFSALHLFNDGVTALALINIVLCGVLMSLPVYYMDSLWCAFGIHAGWNYTQAIIFGLPNSGSVLPYSIFHLDASTARDSFAYNVGFGVEGTVLADIILLVACVVFVCIFKAKKKNK